MRTVRALPLVLAACLALSACGSTASSAAASSEAAQSGESDAYAYLADFDPSAMFDDNGYIKEITAADYVTLPEDFNALQLPAGTDEVSEETLDDLITDNILVHYQYTEEITNRAAEMGDTVNIDYVGSVDGVEFDGGSTGGNGTDLELTGSNYIDDFEEQIAGHMPGDTFNVEVTFPDPYKNNPDLAGKDAVFVTTLHYIVNTVTPELTDDFVKENLDPELGFTTAEEVRADMREQAAYSLKAAAIMRQLEENATFAGDLPQALLDHYRDRGLLNLYTYAQYYNVSLDDIVALQYGYENTAAYIEANMDSITTLAQDALLIQAAAEKLGYTCDEATMRDRFSDYFSYDLDSMIERDGASSIMNAVLQYIVMDTLVENATVAAE